MLRPEQIAFSVACLANYDLWAALEAGRKLGLRSVELLAFAGARHSIGELAGFWFEELSPAERERLRAAVADFVYLSIHAPFIHLPLFTHNPGIRREARRQMRVTLEATAYLGGTVSVVHVNARPFLKPRDYWEEMVDTFRKLGDFAGEVGVKIALETGYPHTVEDYCGLIEDVAHESVGACVDVGHLVAYMPAALRGTLEGVQRLNDTLLALVERLGAKVFSFHLHDVRAGDFRDHRAVGRGVLHWERLLRYVHRSAFAGPLVLELEEPDVEEALRESQKLLEGMLERFSVRERKGAPP
ncbi:MAG TPA: sugar phosphate isomerase/epimerase [Armatimonadetes bacterium]|nr:sugar phosphate isomerase/epimerase [Armatimonadota bacterium]